MKLVPTALPSVVLIAPAVHADDRGWFMESSMNHPARSAAGAGPAGAASFSSCSRAGVLRGLHYQLSPHAQCQLVP